MTTEIAVSNRLGIALASDSAVTIRGRGRVKIFDTADKLFELSLKHPIGVMINGNMDCLSVPWEILVKDFRDKEGTKYRAKVTDWTKDFLAYVESHMLINDTAINKYIDGVIEKEIDIIQFNVATKIRRHIFEHAAKTKKPPLNIGAFLASDVRERMAFLLQFPIADSLANTRDNVVSLYSEKIDARMIERFEGQTLSPNEVGALRGLVVEALLRAIPSDSVAGLVIAGFGCDETFPSVHSVEVDGRVAGRLKYTELNSASIITSKDGGQVTSYAQTDVIQRLLEGADPRFIQTTADFIEKAVTAVAELDRNRSTSPQNLEKEKRCKAQDNKRYSRPNKKRI